MVGIRLSTTWISDEQLGALRGLSSLRSLDLTQTRGVYQVNQAGKGKKSAPKHVAVTSSPKGKPTVLGTQ